MTELFVNTANRVYMLYYGLIIGVVLMVAIGTPVARYLTGNPTLELIPASLYSFLIEVGKPVVYPVMIITIGPLLPEATRFLVAFRGGNAEQKEPAAPQTAQGVQNAA